MLLLPDTVIDTLVSSRSVRISVARLMPPTIEQYADAAKRGGALLHLSWLDAVLTPVM
jgi:hypothetical protein